MKSNYTIGYINSTDTVNVVNICNIMNNIGYPSTNDIVYDNIKEAFRRAHVNNILSTKTIGVNKGTLVHNISETNTEALIDSKSIIPTNIGEDSNSRNPFYSAQFSFVHPNGIDMYGSYFSKVHKGLYHYNTITKEFTKLHEESRGWSYFTMDSKGNIYCAPWGNEGVTGLFVILPDKTLHTIYTPCTGFYGFHENEQGLYISSGGSGGLSYILYIDNSQTVPVATPLYNLSYAYMFPVKDYIFIGSSYLNGLLLVNKTECTHIFNSTGNYTSLSENTRYCITPNNYFYIASINSKGVYCLLPDLTEVNLLTGSSWSVCNLHEDYIIAYLSNRIVVIKGTEIIYDYTISSLSFSNTNIYKYNNYIFFWGSSKLFVLYDGTVTLLNTSSGTIKYDEIRVHKISSGAIYISLGYYVYFANDGVVTNVLSGSSSTMYTFLTSNDELICSTRSKGYSSGYLGIYIISNGTSKSYIKRTNGWNNIFEDSKNNVYISSIYDNRASTAGGYDTINAPISGLWLYKDSKCTQIYGGYGWSQFYEDKHSNVYLSSTAQPSYGILKVDDANVKRIWDKSVSFKYVQETPNGLLVADTEFIGPDDKILYIKGDRVMETSINEINAYNKEANNE